jgi:hypothetical protein
MFIELLFQISLLGTNTSQLNDTMIPLVVLLLSVAHAAPHCPCEVHAVMTSV